MNPHTLFWGGLWPQIPHQELGDHCPENMETGPSEIAVIPNFINPCPHHIYSSGVYYYAPCSRITEASKDSVACIFLSAILPRDHTSPPTENKLTCPLLSCVVSDLSGLWCLQPSEVRRKAERRLWDTRPLWWDKTSWSLHHLAAMGPHVEQRQCRTFQKEKLLLVKILMSHSQREWKESQTMNRTLNAEATEGTVPPLLQTSQDRGQGTPASPLWSKDRPIWA